MGDSLMYREQNNILIGTLVTVTIICLIAIGPYFRIQNIVTNGLIPGLFLLAFFYDARSFHQNNSEFIWLLLIFVGGLTSIFYYRYYDAYVTNLSIFFGAVLSAYIPVGLNKKKDYGLYFHIGYIIAALLLIGIMYNNGNFSFSNFASKVDYRNRFMLNANMYSYMSFFANFSLFFLHQRYQSKLITILLLVLPILFLIISFVTQSRQGLILISLVNIVYWLFINVPRNNNSLKKTFRKIIIITALIGLSVKFVDVYQNSRIKNRIEGTTERDSRGSLIANSIEVFTMYPILGVGLGQLPLLNKIGQFSHNSYVEILAEQGIIGGIMLLMLFGIPLKKCMTLFRHKPDDPYIRLLLLFFISFYFYNNIYVFYKFPFSMMYFFLVISMQNKLYSAMKKQLATNIQ